MSPIASLIWRNRHGHISFDDLLKQVPLLQWAVRREESDGEVWWDGENSVGDIDLLWYEDIITDDEREAIIAAIP